MKYRDGIGHLRLKNNKSVVGSALYPRRCHACVRLIKRTMFGDAKYATEAVYNEKNVFSGCGGHKSQISLQIPEWVRTS